jgi:hypothetical protein
VVSTTPAVYFQVGVVATPQPPSSTPLTAEQLHSVAGVCSAALANQIIAHALDSLRCPLLRYLIVSSFFYFACLLLVLNKKIREKKVIHHMIIPTDWV